MKRTFIAAVAGILGFTLFTTSVNAENKNSGLIPTPDRVAEYIVGTWRYGIFKVEYTPLDSSGVGRVNAAGRKGIYLPTPCGPGNRGNMLIRDADEEVCVVVKFVDGVQVIQFPPRGSSAAKEVQLYPMQ